MFFRKSHHFCTFCTSDCCMCFLICRLKLRFQTKLSSLICSMILLNSCNDPSLFCGNRKLNYKICLWLVLLRLLFLLLKENVKKKLFYPWGLFFPLSGIEEAHLKKYHLRRKTIFENGVGAFLTNIWRKNVLYFTA